jgi:hypothetical protein
MVSNNLKDALLENQSQTTLSSAAIQLLHKKFSAPESEFREVAPESDYKQMVVNDEIDDEDLKS